MQIRKGTSPKALSFSSGVSPRLAIVALLVCVSLSYVIPTLLVLAIEGWNRAGGYATSHLNSGVPSLEIGLESGVAVVITRAWYQRRGRI